MTRPTSGPPTDWPGLLAQLRADPTAMIRDFARHLKEMEAKAATSPAFGTSFRRALEALNMALLLGQGPHMAKPLALLHDHARAVADADETEVRERRRLSLDVLSGAAVSDMAGHGRWDTLIDTSLQRLWSRRPAQGQLDIATAWASLAFGHTQQILAILQLPRNSPANEAVNGPFRTAWDAQRQIARVLDSGGTPDQAAPAWRAWLRAFPPALANEQTDWNNLMWAARAVYAEIGGRPPTDVPAQLLADIEAL